MVSVLAVMPSLLGFCSSTHHFTLRHIMSIITYTASETIIVTTLRRWIMGNWTETFNRFLVNLECHPEILMMKFWQSRTAACKLLQTEESPVLIPMAYPKAIPQLWRCCYRITGSTVNRSETHWMISNHEKIAAAADLRPLRFCNYVFSFLQSGCRPIQDQLCKCDRLLCIASSRRLPSPLVSRYSGV